MTSIPLAVYPGMNPFVLDWLAGEERATQFLPRAEASAAHSPPAPPPQLVQALIDSNRQWGLFASNALRRWAAGGTTTLIAGQQVGFAGGPLYTLAKLATLVKMKRELEKRGQPATAFFWLATEDHDFDEVAQLSLPVNGIERDVNRQLNLLCVRERRAVESREMVGPMPIPERLISEFLALYGIERPSWLRPGVTFGDSFAELIGTVFGDEVILVDSLLPELRRAGAALFGAISARWKDIERALAHRAAELQRAGYPPQVAPRENGAYTLLFEMGNDGVRHIIESPREIDAERISTSALTRPLLQDFVLRPDIFIGGPAEVSYYAQIAPLHSMLNVPMPRVALRGHALVAPKRVIRFMGRYAINPQDVFSSPDSILADREPEGVAQIKAVAAEGTKQLISRIESIGELALPADHSLARAINKSIGHIEYHFAKLTERAIKGLVRKDRERYAAARELVATLFPDGHVQDRIVGWFPYWHQFGRHLADRIVEEIEPDSASCRIVSL